MHTLRLVEKRDLPTLAKVLSRSFTQADPEKPWDEDHSYEHLKYWFEKQSDLFYLATDGSDNPLGAMAVNIKPWRTNVRCNDGILFVDPLHQNKGVGRDLFRKVIKESVDKYNAETFEGITFAGKEFPMSWYEKLGITKDNHTVVIVGKCKEILDSLGN